MFKFDRQHKTLPKHSYVKLSFVRCSVLLYVIFRDIIHVSTWKETGYGSWDTCGVHNFVYDIYTTSDPWRIYITCILSASVIYTYSLYPTLQI